jgi:predicted AAA+ superfamily ATPase
MKSFLEIGMHRFALDYLEQWKDRRGRMPLIVRGARQVGKSFLVKLFAETNFTRMIEVNFERDPEHGSLFSPGPPLETVRRLEVVFNQRIEPGNTLLFLDEIQAAPDVLAALRYFHEELPQLHVVAAGSLLDFVLEEHEFSMPVGRVEYLHLGPMLFEEYLLAVGEDRLFEYLRELRPGETVIEAIHGRLLALLRQYMVIGGMPAAIEAFLGSGSLQECDAVKQSILSTYQDDFSKYRRRVNHERLMKVYRALPRLVGSRFAYVQVDRDERSKDLAAALQMLSLARVAHRVYHSSSNGVPLGAEINERKLKILFLDVGLMIRALGLGLLDLERAENLLMVNQGAVCEQLVGQHLLYSRRPYEEPELHFWAREKRNSQAEVDYVISEGATVVPIEVKAGKTGTLKSLHLFLREKASRFGVRVNSEPPSLLEAETSLPGQEKTGFTLLSLPLYMIGQLRRLVRETRDR